MLAPRSCLSGVERIDKRGGEGSQGEDSVDDFVLGCESKPVDPGGLHV